MKIPNSFLTQLTHTELMVACRLYAVVNSHTKVSKNGYEVCIKQRTTYHYALKPFSFLSDFFFMHKSVFKRSLSPKQFYVYALCCKLKCNDTAGFYQSYNDLAKLTGMKRSEIMKLMKELSSKKLIRIRRKRTKLGDFTDNTYFVITYQRGRIKKKRKAFHTRLSPDSDTLYHHKCNIMITQMFGSVKGKNAKKRKNFSIDGGG